MGSEYLTFKSWIDPKIELLLVWVSNVPFGQVIIQTIQILDTVVWFMACLITFGLVFEPKPENQTMVIFDTSFL